MFPCLSTLRKDRSLGLHAFAQAYYGGRPGRRRDSFRSPREPSEPQPAFSRLLRLAICQSTQGRTTVIPIALPTSRLVDSAGFDPTPHSLDRQGAPRRYGFDDRVELYAQRAAAREATRQAELKALEKVARQRRAVAKREHEAGVRRQKEFLRSIGVPDLSSEEMPSAMSSLQNRGRAGAVWVAVRDPPAPGPSEVFSSSRASCALIQP